MYFLKRTLNLIPVLLIISFAAFLLVRLAPGGPFDSERAPASRQVEAELAERYHLDEPLLRQYLRFLGGVVTGDLGPSLKYRDHSVQRILIEGLSTTLLIGGCSFAYAVIVGASLGVIATIRRGGWLDGLLTSASMVAVCVPPLVLGPILVMVFAVGLGWFPLTFLESPLHLVLPVLALGSSYAGRVARLVREGMEDVIGSQFVQTARSKGLRESEVVVRHCLRAGMLPVVSFSAPLMADLLTGSFVVENLFQIAGVGTFLVNASINRDYPMIVGLVLFYAVVLLVMNLVADVIYGKLDPRVKWD